MKIIPIEASQKTRYEAFVRSCGGALFQSYAWGEFQKSLPGRGGAWAWAVTEGDRWLGSVLVIRHRLPFGRCWFSVARGPLFAEDADREAVWALMMTEIQAMARRETAVFLRVEPEAVEESDRANPLFKGKGWRPAHAHHQPEWTLMVDLTPSHEDILAQMKQKGRYNIRVAKRKGVTVRTTHAPKDVSAFYSVLQKTGERDGFSIHPEDYYQQFVAAAQAGNWGALLLAEADGQAIGGILATFYGDTGMYYYGASDHTHRALMAPYLVQWVAMQEAKARGCCRYDFLGIAPPDQPDHPWKGITQFKTKFGGKPQGYPEALEYVFSPFWYWAMRIKKSLRSH